MFVPWACLTKYDYNWSKMIAPEYSPPMSMRDHARTDMISLSHAQSCMLTAGEYSGIACIRLMHDQAWQFFPGGIFYDGSHFGFHWPYR